MPKKPKKSREEKAAEEYLPIGKDLKNTIEKQVKEGIPKEEIIKSAVEKIEKPMKDKEELIKQTIEKTHKKPSIKERIKIEKKGDVELKRKIKKKKTRKTPTKRKEYEIPKINLKKDGYELIITEKPQAAQKISSALGKASKKDIKKIPYYEINRNGKRIIVACAVGHLFTLMQNSKGSNFPVFDISWVPNFYVRQKDFSKKYYDTMLGLAKKAGELTVATDFDVEGEVIGRNVVKYICGQEDAKRMKFSTLTPSELEESYENKLPNLSWGQAIAGETRHYLDWFYGINLSRALMSAIKTTGRFKIMSIGRVQGPALKLIVEKEKEIKKFEPKPYWQIFAKITDGNNEIELKHNKDIFNKENIEKFYELEGKETRAKTDKKEQEIPPNPPFNLTNLQTEAYKLYGINPASTLRTAQSLYLSGLISYPRTSSEKLPPSIGYQKILKKLSKEYNVENLIKRKTPIEGKKSDPAHPAIYPTGQSNIILSGNEDKIYNLIVKRFLSAFCENAVIENKKIEINPDNTKFSTKGVTIKKKSWLEIYPSKLKEETLPEIKEEVKITKIRNEEKETKPPKRFTQASIISELEKRNLGTKATRANVLETLYDRGYVRGTSIEATPLGISLIETLEKNSPIIIDEKLTKEFENEIEEISEEKKKDQLETQKNIIGKAKETIKKISGEFKENEKEIGKELLNANIEHLEEQKKANTLTPCPECKKGNLIINYSKKNRRFFVACDAYPKCTKTYSLPPNGTIKKTDKKCEECGFPRLMSLRKGSKPWIFCFNPECPTNKKRLEEYYRKKAEQENPEEQK